MDNGLKMDVDPFAGGMVVPRQQVSQMDLGMLLGLPSSPSPCGLPASPSPADDFFHQSPASASASASASDDLMATVLDHTSAGDSPMDGGGGLNVDDDGLLGGSDDMLALLGDGLADPSQPQQQQQQQQPQSQSQQQQHYESLGSSLLALPVHDTASQFLRPPDFFSLDSAPPAAPTGTPSFHGHAGHQAKVTANAAPWSGLFANGPPAAGAAKKPFVSPLYAQLTAPYYAVQQQQQQQQPVISVDLDAAPTMAQSQLLDPQTLAPLQAPAIGRLPSAVVSPPVAVAKAPAAANPRAAPAAARPKATAATGAPASKSSRKCHPAAQRAKRKAIADLFLQLKQTCYGDAVGRDPAVTDAIGRGRRSVNSKEAILRKAASEITRMEARAAALEAEVDALESSTASPASPGSAVSVAPAAQAQAQPQPQAQNPAKASRASSHAGLYADSSAPRLLMTAQGRLVSYSAAVPQALNMPAEALELAARGDLSAYALLPASLRARYYEVLPGILSAPAGAPAAAEVAVDGSSVRMWVIRCGSGANTHLDHVLLA